MMRASEVVLLLVLFTLWFNVIAATDRRDAQHRQDPELSNGGLLPGIRSMPHGGLSTAELPPASTVSRDEDENTAWSGKIEKTKLKPRLHSKLKEKFGLAGRQPRKLHKRIKRKFFKPGKLKRLRKKHKGVQPRRTPSPSPAKRPPRRERASPSAERPPPRRERASPSPRASDGASGTGIFGGEEGETAGVEVQLKAFGDTDRKAVGARRVCYKVYVLEGVNIRHYKVCFRTAGPATGRGGVEQVLKACIAAAYKDRCFGLSSKAVVACAESAVKLCAGDFDLFQDVSPDVVAKEPASK